MTERSSAYNKGQELAAAQKNEAALIAFEEAAKKEPSNFKAVFGLGLMAQQLGEHSKAVEAFSEVIRMQPQIAEAFYSRALSLQDLDHHTEALTDLHAALALRLDYLDAEYALGVSLKKLDRFDEAERVFSKVLSQAESYPAASHGRATVRYALGDHAGAIEDFTTCLENGIDDYGLRLLRGLAFHRSGRPLEALEDLSRAIAFRPSDGSTYIRRWEVYKKLGDETRAAEDMVRGKQLLDESKTE